jgi:hypothetical protein
LALLIAVAACFGSFSTLAAGGLQERPDPEDRQQQTRPETQQPQTDRTQQAEQSPEMEPGNEAAALGVLVSENPGDGVHVVSSLWGSPAQRAGIRAGDYVMAVNDQKIATTEELQKAVESHEAGTMVTVTIWRDGQTFDKEIALAERAENVPDSHRAWMGVVLTPAGGEEEGVRVQRVYPGSPADEAGLQADDVITETDGKPVTNIESLLECMESHGPGAGCKLTVQRNGQEQAITVTLGEVDSAPEEWTIQAFRIPLESLDLDSGMLDMEGRGESPRWQEELRNLRQEVMELRRRIDELDPSGAQGQRDRDQNRPDNAEGKDGAAALSAIFPNTVSAALVAAAEPGAPAARQQQRRYWQGQHYGYRYPYYGNYWYGNYWNPYGHNWYYNHGGHYYYHPWYYQQHYYYGPRYGIRIGPSWGVYWY